MTALAESHIEEAALALFAKMGYSHRNASEIAPDSRSPERFSYSDVILRERLKNAISLLNPNLPSDAWSDAVRIILQSESPSLVSENRRLHKQIVEGVNIEFYGDDGVIHGEHVKLINFDDPDENDWLVVNQFTVIENKTTRRADIVVFVNGLPLAVIELKNPGGESATLGGAFNQLQNYKKQIPSLFRTNAALIISDGLEARIGSLTADPERFMPWRTVDGDRIEPKGTPELETLLLGVFEKRKFLDLIRDFTVFAEAPSGLNKILAGYHQFHAVRRAVASTLAATRPNGDRRVGVVWHTQGSGKSLLMAFYAGQVIKHPLMENPTLIVITDRKDLDDQLFGTFGMCRDLIRTTPEQAESRDHLRALLDTVSGGVIFTTIQKFAPEGESTTYPLLTARRNVIVIADEAHRSQYGFKAKIATDTGAISYGFAKYLRDAVPNASFIGFTGTPIEEDDVNTPVVFGNYIDIYDISRAVSDGATVPIYYESRLARIELLEEERPKIDAEIAEILEEEDSEEQERINRKLTTVEALVGSDKRLAMVAKDLVQHFEDRVDALEGKAMIVCMSRRICVALYEEITDLRPDWHNDADDAGKIKIVMTGSSADPEDWQQHIGRRQKARRDLLAKRIKSPDDPLKLVIVRDMWLTGFDAPCLHTMYIDKPMYGHGLMQAIARVNRVFRDKPAGLVVDYIGIAQFLKEALGQYSNADREETGADEARAVAFLLEQYGIVRDMFWPDTGGFDYRVALAPNATPHQRLTVMAGAIDWILSLQQRESERETTEEGRKRAHRRYADAVLLLTKGFALTSATDAAREIRDEVGFFQAVRSAMAKTGFSQGRSATDREFAIRQIISRAVVSTEIIDIMKAAGIHTPDISILSDEFLKEVRELDKKNLALEALRKLINGEVHSQSRRNVVQARAFSERLESAIARYHNNAITTVQVLEDLIQLAKDIRAARTRGEESALSQEEVAFYDALANNKSARDLISEPTLRVIAHELLVSVRGNITVDWMHRDASRARIRVTVKRILRKYGYPPDLQDEAVQTVLQQAEALSAEWAEAL